MLEAASARSQRTEFRQEHLRLEYGLGGCVPQWEAAALQEVGAALPASPRTSVKSAPYSVGPEQGRSQVLSGTFLGSVS